MEFHLPTSMTALVNVKFHYDEEARKLVGEAEIQLLDELLGNAQELKPELQEVLFKFAQTMNRTAKGSQEKKG